MSAPVEIEVTGDTGQTRVGYQCALIFRDWTLVRSVDTLSNHTSTINGKVGFVDSYWSSLPPTKVSLYMGKSWWVWSNVKAVLGTLSVGSVVSLMVEGDPVAQDRP